MDCLDGSYPIRAHTLGDVRRGTELPDWSLHMASKRWVLMTLFIEAFEHALETHKGKYKQKFQPGWHEAVWKVIAKIKGWPTDPGRSFK
jgi:hypothetical protein